MASPKRRSSSPGRLSSLGLVLVVLVIGWLVRSNSCESTPIGDSADRSRAETNTSTLSSQGDLAIQRAFEGRRSDLDVKSSGVVTRVLADDEEGSRHQRFVVELASGHTLLISHNIDLAPRVPLSRGDHVEFRGEYEWNERGGVVHWTHHDPRGQRDGGWIRHRGRTYD